ncbi:MAG: alpha-amylase family glycosyl hydrolase [Ignavibacteriaceae bacterium]
MIKKNLLLFIFLISLTPVTAQNFKVNKIEPPNWWAGMKLNKIQLMVYGDNLNNISAKFNNDSIKVIKVHQAVGSSSYTFLDIEIPKDLPSGNYKLTFTKNNSVVSVEYPVLQRNSSNGKYQGFNQGDVIYLIVPDRFSDGDTANNVIAGMNDECNVNNPIDRHGGDIRGIINHLNYLKDLGVTTLWISPLIENNTDKNFYGYAGYSATDLYKIDPRFGTNKLYNKLVQDAHKIGLKIILDHVSNHISISHPWIKDLPFPDWINGSVKKHLITNHDKLAFADIHRDSSTIKINTEGWFTNYLPDLNQANPFVANYLIQNTIWWIESSGIDGIREDTYPYCDQKYLANWAKEILNEYPKLNIFGEVWTGDAVFLSSFQRHSFYPKKFDTNLLALTDFATYDIYSSFLRGKSTLSDIYEDFAKDFIYPDPNNLVTFIDNHDVRRSLAQANGDVNKFEMALTMLLTSRGIPEIFYGTEIGMMGGDGDGLVRADFPGGFPVDKQNAFTVDGRTKNENNIYDFVHRLLSLRLEHKALSFGKLIQFPPVKEIFVYFKSYNEDRIMVVLNNNYDDKQINLSRYHDQLKDARALKNLLTGETVELNKNAELNIKGTSEGIYQLLK